MYTANTSNSISKCAKQCTVTKTLQTSTNNSINTEQDY